MFNIIQRTSYSEQACLMSFGMTQCLRAWAWLLRTRRVFYSNIKYRNIVGYIGVICKMELKKSGLHCFLLIESLKTGVLGENKLKKSLEIKKIGF